MSCQPKQDSYVEATSDLTISSSYELKHFPFIASQLSEEEIEALNANFRPAFNKNNIIPDVEATNFPDSYILPKITRDILEKKNFKVDKLNEISNGYVKSFINSLNKVIMNAGLDIGTAESKTDSLVNQLLTRIFEFDCWPFSVRVNECYKLSVSDRNVKAYPGFVVDMNQIVVLVIENKHLKNISAPDFGEAQILAEILSCGFENLLLSQAIMDQTIYAIRVISSYVTFYKVTIPVAYWKELKRGLPQKQSITILRWPGRNYKESGLDLAVPDDRHSILEAIVKIRQSLLQTASTTTISTTEQSTSSGKGKKKVSY